MTAEQLLGLLTLLADLRLNITALTEENAQLKAALASKSSPENP